EQHTAGFGKATADHPVVAARGVLLHTCILTGQCIRECTVLGEQWRTNGTCASTFESRQYFGSYRFGRETRWNRQFAPRRRIGLTIGRVGANAGYVHCQLQLEPRIARRHGRLRAQECNVCGPWQRLQTREAELHRKPVTCLGYVRIHAVRKRLEYLPAFGVIATELLIVERATEAQ